MKLRLLLTIGITIAGAASSCSVGAEQVAKNAELVQECRYVLQMNRRSIPRYLQSELFRYEMAFSVGADDREIDRLERNLAETCSVVARSNGIRVSLSTVSQGQQNAGLPMADLYVYPSVWRRERRPIEIR